MWCEENGEKAGTQKKFSGNLTARGYKKELGTAGAYKGKMVWHGIGVRGDDGGDGRPDGPDRPPNGPESRVEPSTASQSSTDPLPSEKGIDKPDSSTPVEGRG